MLGVLRLAASFLILLGLIVLASRAHAQTIERIFVEGNQRIEPSTVRSYMLVREGDPMDPARVDRSLKSLFATGLFADVSMRREGNDIVVRVVENPIINRVAFEGNSRIDDETLAPEIQLRPRSIYTRAKVQEDAQRILELYQRQGRFAATVSPKVIERPQNRVDLVFEISEGDPTYIRRIDFIGNAFATDSQLREEIATKEERFYRVFSAFDTYDPDRLTFDRELLRRYYLNNGFADFRILSAVAEITPDREGFFITFTVEEGPRYEVDAVDIEVNLPDLDPAGLSQAQRIFVGDWYSAERVEDTIQALTELVGERGYAFVDVVPRLDQDRETRTIGIVFEINEGPKVFVNRINISGNVRTKDKVIRREVRLVEGDAFNSAKLRRSRTRIQDLDYFETVELTTEPSAGGPDKVDVNIEVEEKSTGALTFGLGYSSQGGLLLSAGIAERNLVGTGLRLNLEGSVGQSASSLNFGLTEPYFLDRPLAASYNVFYTTEDRQDESSFDVSTFGQRIGFGWSYNEFVRQSAGYLIRRDKISNVQSDASEFILQQRGTRVLSQLEHGIIYDRRDSRLNPTNGWAVGLNNDLAGLGGDLRFLRTDLNYSHYWPVFEESVFSFAAFGGYIFGIGDSIDITQRYFLGGADLRGFESAGVGARDIESGDALGGNWQVDSTVQLQFPLGLPEELGVDGRTFFDVGSIGEPENVDDNDVFYDVTPRASAGVGILWESPAGPINLDFGFPVVKEDYDKTEIFRFNFGARF